jgi:hypothetical protein
MNSATNSTTAVSAPAPTIDGVRACVLELISLLEVVEDMSGDIPLRQQDGRGKRIIERVQNLSNIAVHYARFVDLQIHDFIEGERA